MTRVIAGRFGGRRLNTPAGRDTRPSSDRVREGLFSALCSRIDLTGSWFADLYAGSGAVGLEALSRGAEHVMLVESDKKAARVIRDNVAVLGVERHVTVAVDRIERLATQPPRLSVNGVSAPRFDVAFADPPYRVPNSDITDMLHGILANDWLTEGAVVIVERSAREAPFSWVSGITPDGMRRYGETALWYGRVL